MRRNKHRSRDFGRTKTLLIRGTVITGVSTVVGILICTILFGGFTNRIAAEFAYAMTQADTSEISETEMSDADSGTISRAEWKKPVSGDCYGSIVCEKAGIDVPLYMGDTDEILLNGVGQSVSAYCPGEGGTILVGGHDTTFFSPLQNVSINDTIEVKTSYGLFTYRVSAIDVVKGSECSIDDSSEKLLLYTCYPFGDVVSERRDRIIYSCDKVSGPDISEPEIGGPDDDKE